MRQLETIQKEDNLNKVYAIDDAGPGGANHTYLIEDVDHEVHHIITFQKGPRTLTSSVHGVIDGDLLEIVRDRLKAFQAGPYATRYNEEALFHVEAALNELNQRVVDRKLRGVLGTENK